MIEKIERRNTIRKYVMIITAIIIGIIFFVIMTSLSNNSNMGYTGGKTKEYAICTDETMPPATGSPIEKEIEKNFN